MTLTDINEYKYQIAESFGSYAKTLSDKVMLGSMTFCDKMRFVLLDNCVQIMFDYLDAYLNEKKRNVNDENFMSAEEIHDIEQIINNILETQYHIDFSESLTI